MPVYNIVTKENCEQPENYIKGDMNDDKEVDVRDLVRLKKMVAGITDKTTVSDVNIDGVVNAIDLTNLRKIILGN